MDVTKPYNFIGFGAVDVTKPSEFIGFGAMDVTKPYEFRGFGAMEVTKSHNFMGFGAHVHQHRQNTAPETGNLNDNWETVEQGVGKPVPHRAV